MRSITRHTNETMADAPLDVDALRAAVTKQGATVRELKKGGAPQVRGARRAR